MNDRNRWKRAARPVEVIVRYLMTQLHARPEENPWADDEKRHTTDVERYTLPNGAPVLVEFVGSEGEFHLWQRCDVENLSIEAAKAALAKLAGCEMAPES